MTDAQIVEVPDRAPATWSSPAGQVTRLRDTLAAIEEAMKEVMREGVDYGVIQGTRKPSLFKPGAEILLRLFNYALEVEIEDQVEDWDTPFFRYKVKVTLRDGSGRAIGEGMGEANSREPRYQRRYCPKCEDGVWDNRPDHRKGVRTDQPAFACKSRRCDWSAAKPSEVPTEFDFALVNTLLKMAGKRAKVEATLTATAASHFFTQDVEDLEPDARASVDAPATVSGGHRDRADTPQGPSLACPACGSKVYDNRADIDSGKRGEKFPAFRCSSGSCTGVTGEGEEVTDGKVGEPWVTWHRNFFDEPVALGSAELSEVEAHIGSGAITESAVLSIARRLAKSAGLAQPTSLAEIGGLPGEVQLAVVEAVAVKIGGGE